MPCLSPLTRHRPFAYVIYSVLLKLSSEKLVKVSLSLEYLDMGLMLLLDWAKAAYFTLYIYFWL